MRRSDDQKIMLGMFSLAFFFTHFHRIALGVLAHDIQASLKLGGASLGMLSSTYLYVYGAMQVVVGALADRYGVRRLIAGLSLVAAAGSILLGLAPNFPVALVGRALVGIGVSGVYVPALRFLARRLPIRAFATAGGVMVAAGYLGALAATTPLVFVNGLLGWRQTFLVVGFASVLVAWLTWILVDDEGVDRRATSSRTARGTGPRPNRPTHNNVWKQDILRNPTVLSMPVITAGRYGPHVAFLGVWGQLFLTKVHLLSPYAAGNVLMAMSIGYAISGPLLGYVSDLIQRRKAILVYSSAVCFVGWLPMFLSRSPLPAPLLLVLSHLMGLAGGAAGVQFSMVRESVGQDHMGAVFGVVNLGGIFGSALFQSLTGYLLGGTAAPESTISHGSFHSVLAVCVIGSGISLALALTTKEAAGKGQDSTTRT